ncbi:MAG: hypothetical protein IKS48_02690 [Eubacterium sp.]|nr:hypothetical protein [Eubacterium sp.]
MILEKVFGGIKLSWMKLIIFAVIAGVYTAVMALIPALKYTSFSTITTTFEVWVLIGILIIMNSKSNVDSALKCFVFFLISQPLVYLIQVPFSDMGWGLFGYYGYWFIWTILCLPMGFIGYFMKKDKWWGFIILLPMLFFLASSYNRYLKYFIFYCPKYILIVVFCVLAMIICPLGIFKNKKICFVGVIISCVLIAITTYFSIINPMVYHTEIMINGNTYHIEEADSVYFEDEKYGDVKIEYLESIKEYCVTADFKKAGETVLTLEKPNGEKEEYIVIIKNDTYDIIKKKDD